MGSIRCQMGTERGKQVQTQWDEAEIIFVPTVCVKINLQTALGWKPQEDSNLSKQKGMTGVQTHWTSAGLDLHWSPWQLYKKEKPSTSLWRSDVGQDPSAYTGMSVGVWCFSRRGGTASFQPLNGKKTDDLLKGEMRVFLLILKSIHPKEMGIFLSIPEFLFKLQ